MLATFSRIPHRFWYRSSAILMVINLVLLTLVLVPGIGREVNGGRRWIGSTSLHLQPSELAIISTVMYVSFFFTKKVTLLDQFKKGLRPVLILIGLNFVLIMLEPDMGTGATLVAISLVVLIVSGVRLKPLLIVAGILVPIMAILSLTSYRFQRIISFLHPFAHSGGSAYQVIQGWTGIAAGGWFGRGFDMSIEKTGYLPFPETDFIFPVFVEEWGFLGAVALIIVFAVLVWRGFSIARHAADRFSALLAIGLTSIITIPTLINLGAVTGLMPVTGIPLPFISYGGTALIVNLGAIGILLGISRHTLQEEPELDQLASVVAVDEALLQRKTKETPIINTRVSTRSTYSQPAEVHPIRSKGTSRSKKTSETKETSGTKEGWRARQETAAGKSRTASPQSTEKKLRRKTTRTSKAAASGWRARSSQSSQPSAAGKRNEPSRRTSTRSHPFRKDR